MKLELINTINRYNALYDKCRETSEEPLKLTKGELVKITKEYFYDAKVLYFTEVGNLDKLNETLGNITIENVEGMTAVLIANRHMTSEEYEKILEMFNNISPLEVYTGVNNRYKQGVFNIVLFIKLKGRPRFCITGEIF